MLLCVYSYIHEYNRIGGKVIYNSLVELAEGPLYLEKKKNRIMLALCFLEKSCILSIVK